MRSALPLKSSEDGSRCVSSGSIASGGVYRAEAYGPSRSRKQYHDGMRVPADIALYGEFGQLILLTEVKGLPETTPRWATETRRDVLRLTRGLIPPYFLVIARDL